MRRLCGGERVYAGVICNHPRRERRGVKRGRGANDMVAKEVQYIAVNHVEARRTREAGAATESMSE